MSDTLQLKLAPDEVGDVVVTVHFRQVRRRVGVAVARRSSARDQPDPMKHLTSFKNSAVSIPQNKESVHFAMLQNEEL